MIRIFIEDLVANAFIMYLSNSNDEKAIRKLSLNKIEKYGNEVVYNLRLKGKFASLILSRNLTEEFIRKYHDWYQIDDDFIILNDQISVDDLINNFTGYLNLDLLVELRKRRNYKLLF